MRFLLLLHLLKEHPLFLVLHNLHSCFLEAWQDLLFLMQAKPNSLSFCESDLHRSQFSLLRNKHTLLMQVLDCCLCMFQVCHADESTADPTHCFCVDHKNLKNFSKFLEALPKYLLRDFSRQASNKQFNTSLLPLDQRTSVCWIAS